MLKFRLFTIFAILFCTKVLAIDFQSALTNAYNYNDNWKSIRLQFTNNIESFPQALSSFLPKVTASLNLINNKINNTVKENNVLQEGIQLEQPIFNGSSIPSLKVAHSLFLYEKNNFYTKEQKVIFDGINIYLDYYLSKEKFSIFEVSLAFYETQLKIIEKKVNLGLATKIDLSRVESAVAVAESNKTTSYAKLQESKSNFLKFFNINPTFLEIMRVHKNLPINLEQFCYTSQNYNFEIRKAKHYVEFAKASELLAKSALLPQVSFKLTALKSSLEPKSLPNTTSSVSLNIPIFSNGGAEYSKVRQAKNNFLISFIEFENQVKQVKADCISSWENFIAARSRVIATKKVIDANMLVYDSVLKEELLGSKTIEDVLEAETKLRQAMIEHIEANSAYIINSYKIALISGQLTAKDFMLKVKYFSPEQEFSKIKYKIIGF